VRFSFPVKIPVLARISFLPALFSVAVRSLTALSLTVLSLTVLTPAALAQVATTTTALTVSPSTVADGQRATLSATVTPSSGSAPSGTVGFYAGSTLFATVHLSDAGVANLTLSSGTIAPGTYSVIAKYHGDDADSASTSSPVTATILAGTTTTLSSASSSYQLGQPATFTASVAGTTAGTPTGTVHFFYGSVLLGSAALNAGSASFTRTIPVNYEAGTYRITAKYSGDSAYAPSSGSFTVSLNFSISPDGAAIATAATQQFSLSPNIAGATWYVNGIAGGNSSVGTISSSGLYTAPASTAPLSLQVTASAASSPHYTTTAVPLYVIPPGVVATTNNGMVASYTINLPAGATVSAQFGTTPSYGLNTWSLPAPTGGGSTQLLVAGMMAKTLYHIQGLVSLPGGLTFTDQDTQFTTTTAVPSYYLPTVAVTTNPDYTPQPGVEFLDQYARSANIFDLGGNLIWSYTGVDSAFVNTDIQPFKLLPNGHLLITEGQESAYLLNGASTIPGGDAIQVLEVDYANTIYNQLTLPTLQANLNASGYVNNQGQQIVLADIHHDTTLNPTTGHMLLITNTLETFTSLPGYPKAVSVLGDVIIDVDPSNNFAVDWVWNEFDHLDINRQPLGFPDWTHTNAIVYSPTDHNILISIRHQNWVLKLNYDDAAGDGTILWHLGYQGDFTLVGGTDPQDWQYAQHAPAFTTPNSTGVFGLTLMDNGNNRHVPSGFVCPVPLTNSTCLYSRAPIFTIDENAMTATLSNAQIGPGYNNYGGNSELLANGDMEADYCSVGNTAESVVQESTPGQNPQIVWQLDTTNGTSEYRAFREPSPYPGVTWSAAAQLFQAEHATHPADK
jgi:arylsulfate sulfotransferase